ncbi:NADH:flavin oxidoreductase [bacterium]|nr:NADH:flavin oxidoreductase [bacterium]
MTFPRMASFKSHDQLTHHLEELGLEIPVDGELPNGVDSALSQAIGVGKKIIGNRFCILPMEGWDGTTDGKPSDLTIRRWRSFGASGAKLIWGGEAVAVRHDGRANPNQLLINDQNLADLENLKNGLVAEHQSQFGYTDDLLVGLQLTHSGRYARPNLNQGPLPRPISRNPVLDDRLGITSDAALFSDDELKTLIQDFIAAAIKAEKAGFDFVDVKHCHGYLGHELLSGTNRVGEFGGSFENRTRFLREIVEGIRSCTKSLELAVRISIFDFLPFQRGPNGAGEPVYGSNPRSYFGSDTTGLEVDLSEPHRFMELLESMGISLVCTTAGSPYYTPHIQRPAFFPPSDGYQPPEDPLVGVARQLVATRDLKKQHANLVFVGSGYSYLQDWLPNVAEAVVREGWVDSVGLGRMVLSYPELPADVLRGVKTQRKKVCRTFSDCTTAPRHGMISGCFPLDPFYRQRPEREALKELSSQNSQGQP